MEVWKLKFCASLSKTFNTTGKDSPKCRKVWEPRISWKEYIGISVITISGILIELTGRIYSKYPWVESHNNVGNASVYEEKVGAVITESKFLSFRNLLFIGTCSLAIQVREDAFRKWKSSISY